MGCAQDRDALAFEENELTSREEALFFYHFTSELLDLRIRKYSSGDIITPRQLHFITSSLGLPGANNSKSDVSGFYSSLYFDSGYLRRNLILVCVLLGNATEPTKADLIFEAFDDDSSRMMEAGEFDNMWDCLVDNALVHLPALISPQSSATADYLTQLRHSAPSAKVAIKKELMGEEPSVSMMLFRYRVTHRSLRCLLSPSGLRRMLHKHHTGQHVKDPMLLGKGLRADQLRRGSPVRQTKG